MSFELPPEGAPRTIPLAPQQGLSDTIYVLERLPAVAIQIALKTGRPLLVRGEPGIGKTQLARAASALLKRPLIAHAVTSHTETNDLLWSADLVARLTEAQLAKTKADRPRTALRNFILPGPLWWAMNREAAEAQLDRYKKATETDIAPPCEASSNGVVLLIDEIDKADAAIPNGLLDALGHGGFNAPAVGRITQEGTAPLIIFTTNRERYLPDAFLRRCWVLPLTLPADDDPDLAGFLTSRGKAHFDEAFDDAVYEEAAKMVIDARKATPIDRYRAGIAEFIELLRAVKDHAEPLDLLAELGTFVLDKQGA